MGRSRASPGGSRSASSGRRAWRQRRATCAPRCTARGAGRVEERVAVEVPALDRRRGRPAGLDGRRRSRDAVAGRPRPTTGPARRGHPRSTCCSYRGARPTSGGAPCGCSARTTVPRAWQDSSPARTPAERRGARPAGRSAALARCDAAGCTEPLPLLFRGDPWRCSGGAATDARRPPPDRCSSRRASRVDPSSAPATATTTAVRYCFDASYEELAALPPREGDPVPSPSTPATRGCSPTRSRSSTGCARSTPWWSAPDERPHRPAARRGAALRRGERGHGQDPPAQHARCALARRARRRPDRRPARRHLHGRGGGRAARADP